MNSNSKGRNRGRSKQRVENSNLEEQFPPIVTMADQRTMAEFLQAPTESYKDATVVPAITADNFKLKHGLLTFVQNKQFYGLDKEDPHAHIRYFNKITSTLKFPNVPNTKAWDRFKDLLRACPHHGFSELHQLDTFYNALNSKDQDSLNSAVGVRYSRDKPVVARVSTNTSTSGVSPDVAELKDMVRALLLDKKGQNQSLAPVKAVEESCVTCGGTHSYRIYPATDVFQQPAYQAPAHQAPTPQTQGVSKEDFLAYVKANDTFVNSNTASTSSSSTLPSNTIANPKSDLKAITTRSGVSYDGPQIPPLVVENKPKATKDTVNPTNNRNTEDVQPQTVQSKPVIFELAIASVSASKPNPQASIPYPSRRNDERNREKANNQIEKFYQIFKDMKKLSEMARTPLNEHCSVVLLKKLPEKLGDPGKFLIPCDFPGMAECLALADLDDSINLMPLSVWKKLSLPELTPTCMTLELADHSISRPVGVAEDVYVKVCSFYFSADFVVVDFDADPRVPLILGRSFLKTGRALIDVFEGELTLRVGKEAITFNLDQTLRYSANYSDMTAKRIDVIDMACEEYSQEVLGFSDTISSGNPTPFYDPIVSATSPTLTPFENSDFLLEEEKTALITVLKSHKRAIAWKLSDIKGINLEFCTYKILMEEDFTPAVQHQRRVNPKIHEVIKQEVIKLLDAGLIYPISDSPWVCPVHCVPKKGGITVVENEDNELIPTRLVMGWRVCINYCKLNEATRKDHFPLSFMDQMLERLAGNQYYCFLDGFLFIFKFPSIQRIKRKPHSPIHTERSLIAACHLGYAMLQEAQVCMPPGVKLSSLSESNDTFLSLQALLDLYYLFGGFMDYLWSRMKCVDLVRRSTMTQIVSCSLDVLGLLTLVVGQIVPAFLKELICKVLRLLVLLLEFNRFGILLGEPKQGQVVSSVIGGTLSIEARDMDTKLLSAPESNNTLAKCWFRRNVHVTTFEFWHDKLLTLVAEEEKSNDDWDHLLDFNIDDIPLLGTSSLAGGHLTQEEAAKEALAIKMSQKFSLLEEERPIIETIAYHDKFKKNLDEIVKEEEEAVKRFKGEALKEKKDPGAFIFPIRLEGQVNENALADTGLDINTMPYRIYEQLGREDMKKVDRGITMINHTQAEAMGILINVLCQLGVTTLIAKFLILDIPNDRDSPIVVDRGFLRTIGGITMGTHDDEARSSRSKHSRQYETVEEDVLNRMGCDEKIDDMLRIRLHKARSEEEIFTFVALGLYQAAKLDVEGFNVYFEGEDNWYDKIKKNDLWLLSMFHAKHQNGYVNVTWLIARWMKRKGAGTQKESQICCGQFISKIVRKTKELTEDVLRSLSAPVYCIHLDTTTLRELIDSESKLIPEDP
nr:reverse transcriptase domain-containing protein [Tanacetum cinerariifolium]